MQRRYYRYYKFRFLKTAVRRAVWCCFGLLLATGSVSVSHAEKQASGWQQKTQIHLTSLSSYRKRGDNSSSMSTMAATASLQYRSRQRPFRAGLFADYRFAGENLNLGGFFRHNWQRWDATTWLFANSSSTSAASLMYAGRLRFSITENYKLGIEANGLLNYPGSPSIALGYYGSLSNRFSLNVITDPGISKNVDAAARIELVWQIH